MSEKPETVVKSDETKPAIAIQQSPVVPGGANHQKPPEFQRPDNTPSRDRPERHGGGERGGGRARGGPGGRGRGGFHSGDRKRPMPGDSSSVASDESKGNFSRRTGHGPRDRNSNNEMGRLMERISSINGPTIDLPPLDTSEKKFSGRNRLYVGNLTTDVTKEEMQELFSRFGEVSECFVNPEKMFAFIRFDFRSNAEKARREMDGFVRKGRPMRIRFAPHSASIRVKNLDPFVTNELLEWAFQVFGEIERAVVIADGRGKSIGEGIVEFARRPAASQAIQCCNDMCYFITSSLRPVIVEEYEQNDDSDGFSEKTLFKRGPEFLKAREIGPRFAPHGSFEHEYGQKWKTLHELFRKREEALKRELKLEEEKLEAQMEYARYEHETELLREQLRQRELDKERQKREWELKERAVAEQRTREEEMQRRHVEELERQLRRQQEDEFRRRQQEENMFLQAHQLSNMLDGEENINFEHRNNVANALNSFAAQGELKGLMDSFERHGGGHLRDDPNRSNSGSSRWVPGDRRSDFPNKRRRY